MLLKPVHDEPKTIITMAQIRVFVFCSYVLSGLYYHSCTDNLTFPTGFLFGAATGAYQIEGGWNDSDKAVSIWDDYTHKSDRVNGDVACDSFHLWERDIEMVSELGAQFYRFSISWSRLLPTGFTDQISENGTTYYNKLINGLLAKGIEPMVTLYHWDMPQKIQYLGGWANPLISDWFADYARVVFSLFGDRVRTWITFNEPMVICDFNYITGNMAPGYIIADAGPYLCTKHLLVAHGKAYRNYEAEFKSLYGGKITIGNHLIWYQPYSDSEEDANLTEKVTAFSTGCFTHPIYSSEGGWPPHVESYLSEYSNSSKRPVLPPFTEEEITIIKGSYDFCGVNHYTSRMVRQVWENDTKEFMFGADMVNATLVIDPSWPVGYNDIFPIYPEGLRKLLAWLKKMYGDLEFLITENGYSSSDDGLQDTIRVNFIHDFLEQILLSINEDGVNVTGYTYWTLLDNFEWDDGFTPKLGLYQVNFTDPLRTRTPRASARYYTNVIGNNSLINTSDYTCSV